MSFRFRGFPVYQEIKEYVKSIYILANQLPKREQFELGAQIRRASTSILLNLAEGSMRRSDAELNRFILIGISSIGEIVAILDICLDQKYITSSLHADYMVKSENIVKQLYGFSRKLTKK